MNKWFKNFLAGCAFALGILAVGVTLVGVRAAQISVSGGPAQSNPVGFPPMLGDLVALQNNINTTLAPGGTGTVPNFLSLTGSPITSSAGTIQFLNLGDWSTTLSNCSGATKGNTGTTVCLILLDQTGTAHYIPAF